MTVFDLKGGWALVRSVVFAFKRTSRAAVANVEQDGHDTHNTGGDNFVVGMALHSTRVVGIRDIPDVEHNKEIQDLGRFAVDEYNKQQNVSLSFCKVVKAEEQVVAGVRYYLTIEAKDGSKTEVYAAEIWVKAWENFKQLLDFKPVQTPH